MASRHPLKTIRLELARSKEEPNGSSACGYEFVAPLDAQHHIDVAAWKDLRGRCTARRFWHGEEEQNGFLVHKAGGNDGATWMFDYDDSSSDDDESGYRFGIHPFVAGEYVTLRSQGKPHTFRIVSVENAGA